MLLCSILLPPGQLNPLCWFSVLICVMTIFQRQIQPDKYDFFLLCVHSSAKINSLVYCFECVSPLHCCMFSLAPFFLCIRLKLLVLPLVILFIVYPFCMPCAVRKLNLAASHPLLPVFIAYSFMFFKQESLCFSCGVLHGLRILNICKIHSSCLSVKKKKKNLPRCAINKEKGLNDCASGLLRPLLIFSCITLCLCSFLCLYYIIDILMHILCCRLIFLAYAETLAYAKGQRREQLFVYICISVKPFFF